MSPVGIFLRHRSVLEIQIYATGRYSRWGRKLRYQSVSSQFFYATHRYSFDLKIYATSRYSCPTSWAQDAKTRCGPVNASNHLIAAVLSLPVDTKRPQDSRLTFVSESRYSEGVQSITCSGRTKCRKSDRRSDVRVAFFVPVS